MFTKSASRWPPASLILSRQALAQPALVSIVPLAAWAQLRCYSSPELRVFGLQRPFRILCKFFGVDMSPESVIESKLMGNS